MTGELLKRVILVGLLSSSPRIIVDSQLHGRTQGSLLGAGRRQEQGSVVRTRWSGSHSPLTHPVVESRSSNRLVEKSTTVRDVPFITSSSWMGGRIREASHLCLADDGQYVSPPSPPPTFSYHGEEILFSLFYYFARIL